MPPTERPWFRAYSEMPRDRKLRRERPETRWLWVTLMCMAGASPTRGSLFIGESPATVDDIADEAALPVGKVKAGLGALEAAGMIERNGSGAWHLRNWDSRQFESDRSTERVRAFRQRRGNVATAVSVTPPDTESETDPHQQPCSEPPAVDNPDDERSSATPPIDRTAITVRAVLDRATDARMTTAQPRNRSAYRASVFTEFAAREPELRAVIAAHPTAPVSTLAGWMLGEPNSLHTYRESA